MGPSREISPNAKASGSAIIPTVIPASISPFTLMPKELMLERGLISSKLLFRKNNILFIKKFTPQKDFYIKDNWA
jgi:hypothetical protein